MESAKNRVVPPAMLQFQRAAVACWALPILAGSLLAALWSSGAHVASWWLLFPTSSVLCLVYYVCLCHYVIPRALVRVDQMHAVVNAWMLLSTGDSVEEAAWYRVVEQEDASTSSSYTMDASTGAQFPVHHTLTTVEILYVSKTMDAGNETLPRQGSSCFRITSSQASHFQWCALPPDQRSLYLLLNRQGLHQGRYELCSGKPCFLLLFLQRLCYLLVGLLFAAMLLVFAVTICLFPLVPPQRALWIALVLVPPCLVAACGLAYAQAVETLLAHYSTITPTSVVEHNDDDGSTVCVPPSPPPPVEVSVPEHITKGNATNGAFNCATENQWDLERQQT